MTYVSRLRAVIGPEHLVTRDSGYVLELDGAVYDAALFEAQLAEARRLSGEEAVAVYDAALGLWAGRAFGDDGDEGWLRPIAARLDELRLMAQEERAEQLIECGRHGDAVIDLEGLVAEQPLRERFVALLMRALYLSGRQAEALRAFQRFRDYLADETGLVPSDSLVDLERQVTVGDPSLAPTSVEAVPGYELADVIGEGAFGSVYRAVQPSVGREVAVKVIRPELADDPGFVQRFEAEAQLVARIEHPHVVPLYDFWRRPGGAFLVFRLLRGGSLADRESAGPLGLVEVSRLVEEIGGALTAAHALGVVHRDIKPANVLFDETGNAYLADFGIASLDDPDGTAAAGGAVDLGSAGSPLYASPEQVRDRAASPASDQYALGVVVWEALCGRAPFAGSTLTELGRVKFVEPVPALDAGVDGADALGPILAKATAPHPSDRYPSVAEFVLAFTTAAAGPDLARTTGSAAGAAAQRSVTETLATVALAGVNPYKGLRAFQEADAGEFCGRDALVAELVEKVDTSPVVVVVGPSGSGKSSLVHAGVVPELRRRGALVVSMVPGTDPLVELEAALRRVATVDDEATIAARLGTPGGLTAIARDLAAPGEQLVVVVDQFEELWTLTADTAARDRFAELLAHAAAAPEGGPEGRIRIVATLRADQFDLPLQHPALGPVVSASTFAVTPMTAAELQDAIVVPAERVGVRFEPGLVPTMVGDVIAQPGALPLLQFALTELFEQRLHATITTSAYENLGGISGALARRAEDLYEATPADRRDDVRRLFTQLVTPGDDTDDLRRRAPLEELTGIDPAVIDAYRTNRLIVTDHHPVTREPTLEVAHEALLREWPRLTAWIDADRDTIRVRRALTAAAHDWRATPDDDATLYRGTRLAAADQLAAAVALTGPEQDFLAASHELADREQAAIRARAAHQARQNRRLRRTLTATGALLVLALAAGALAVQQSRRSDEAAAEADRVATAATQARIVADAERLAATDRDVSLLLAAEAARRRPDVASAGALATALLTEPEFLRYEGDTGGERVQADTDDPTGASAADWPAFSPDGSRLAVPDSAAGEVRIVQTRTGAEDHVLSYPAFDGPATVLDVLWPASGTLILVTPEEVVGIDADTGVVRLPATPLSGRAAQWAVSDSGRRLAVVTTPDGSDGTDGTVTVYAVPSGEELTRRPAPCCGTTLGVGGQRVPRAFPGAVAWRGDDLYVASGTGTVEQWDPDDGRRIATLGTDYPAALDLRFVDDGATLVISGAFSFASALMAYDAETGAALWDTSQSAAGRIAEDPRHDAVIVTDPYSGSRTLQGFDLSTGEPTDTWDPRLGSGCNVATSPDGRVLAGFSCERSALALWALDGTGAAWRHVTDHTRWVGFTTWPTTERYAVLTGLEDSLPPEELDVTTGEITPFELPPGFGSLGIGPDGIGSVIAPTADEALTTSEPVERPSDAVFDRTVSFPMPVAGYAAGRDVRAFKWADGSYSVCDSPDRETCDPFRYDGVNSSLLVSADQERLYVGGTAGVRVYDTHDGTLLDEPFPGFLVAGAADANVLAVSDLTAVRLYDGETHEALGDPIDASGAANFTLSPDGTILRIIDNTNGQMQLFDVATQAPIGPIVDLEGGGPAWYSEIFAERDSFLTQRDGSIVELLLDPEQWRERACIAAGRNLTAEEWATHIGGTPHATCPQYPAPA